MQLTAAGVGVSYSAVLSCHIFDGTCRRLRALHTLGDGPLLNVVREATGELSPELVWPNDLGGPTFRIGDRFRHVEIRDVPASASAASG